MADSIERLVESDPLQVGQILVRKTNHGGFVLLHRDDEARDDLQRFRHPEDAVEIAKYDDAGNYRALKTAPNLRRGWRLEVSTLEELTRAFNYFYPGRLAVFAAWNTGQLRTTQLRDTLGRQSGMYRVAAKISDEQIDYVVGDFCRSDGGCLRTILWNRNKQGMVASTKLPPEKFDPAFDQARVCNRRSAGDAHASHSEASTVPLLCQEACNLLVAECRKAVKGE